LRERRFGTQPFGVVPGGGEQLRGDFGAYAVDGRQCRVRIRRQRSSSWRVLSPAGA
jgi:hypothetical protein